MFDGLMNGSFVLPATRQGDLTRLIEIEDVVSPAMDPALAEIRGGMITIGNFDGVHRGHAGLLRELRSMANANAPQNANASKDGNMPAVAVTFDPHPTSVLRPESASIPLTTMATRAERMRPIGIDALVVCRTDAGLLELGAEAFYQSLVGDRLAAFGMVEGPNFYFGRDRTGNVDRLASWCRRDGRQFQIASITDADGRMVSSSRIRQLLDVGDLDAATEMMGHPHRIAGRVVTGRRRGRTIGFPTANLDDIAVVTPGPGVYGGVATVNRGTDEQPRIDRHAAAVNIGANPTFNDAMHGRKVEVHLLNFAGDLYSRTLAVDLHFRLRDIRRFESPDQLSDQLRQDVETIRHRVSVLSSIQP